jgi:hypothetical protein
MGRPRKQEIELTATERASLSDLVRSRTAPQGLVRRARIVLVSAEACRTPRSRARPGCYLAMCAQLGAAVPRPRERGLTPVDEPDPSLL